MSRAIIKKMEFKVLPLGEIDLKDERFRTSFFFPSDELLNSVEQNGLLSPPLITKRGERYVLVSGWKRILACRKLKLSPVSVLVVEDQDDLRLFMRALSENLSTRSLGLAEKAEVLRRLIGFGVEKKVLLQKYLPLLRLPASSVHLESLLSLAEAEGEVKNFVEGKEVPLPLVQVLLEFKPASREFLLPLLRPLGRNKQKEFFEDLVDIMRREDLTMDKIFSQPEFEEVISAENLSPLQRAERVRSALHRRRYPRLSFRKDKFSSALKRMRWPRKARIEPSPFFEDEALTVSFRFKNLHEFRSRLAELEEVSSGKEFPELFEPDQQDEDTD